jgi:hypothetical protein
VVHLQACFPFGVITKQNKKRVTTVLKIKVGIYDANFLAFCIKWLFSDKTFISILPQCMIPGQFNPIHTSSS